METSFEIVELIIKFANEDRKIRDWVIKNCTEDTGFGFENEIKTGLCLDE